MNKLILQFKAPTTRKEIKREFAKLKAAREEYSKIYRPHSDRIHFGPESWKYCGSQEYRDTEAQLLHIKDQEIACEHNLYNLFRFYIHELENYCINNNITKEDFRGEKTKEKIEQLLSIDDFKIYYHGEWDYLEFNNYDNRFKKCAVWGVEFKTINTETKRQHITAAKVAAARKAIQTEQNKIKAAFTRMNKKLSAAGFTHIYFMEQQLSGREVLDQLETHLDIL